jgi:hypothetical protein
MMNMPPDPSSLAEILLLAPAWARVGLTAPSERIRGAAAAELAQQVVSAIVQNDCLDVRQLPLPL